MRLEEVLLEEPRALSYRLQLRWLQEWRLRLWLRRLPQEVW